MVCNMDCFNCQFEDCINDMSPRQVKIFIYNHSDKTKETRKKYEQSDKGKARAKRYEQSDKGKARAKRRTQKDIASGKNAERCRAYYYRKKAKEIANG